MKLSRKRNVALMVLMVLVLASIPVYANSGVTNVTELVDAVNSASDGDVITLSDDFVYENATISVTNENVTIDGQEKTWSTGGITVVGNGTGSLTIKNLNFPPAVSERAFNINTGSRVILDNINVDGRTEGADGGALWLNGNANLEILNSSFTNNTSNASGYSGGAIASKGFNGKLLIDNTDFIGNKTLALGTGVLGGEGGAIYIYRPTGGTIDIVNSRFEKNEAVKDGASSGKIEFADGGAIAIFDVINGATVNIKGNQFIENIAGDDGGAILIQTIENVKSGITIEENNFYGNIAQALEVETPSYNGGAIQVYQNSGFSGSFTSYVDIINNKFENNESMAKNSGGAIASSRPLLAFRSKVVANLYNNEFVNNKPNNTASKPGAAAIVDKGGNIGL